MKLQTLNDEMLRRYLLDDVSDEQRQEIEQRFFEDDSLFEEMGALEDELFFDYKQNRLNAKEVAAFERKFLNTAKDLEKAAFAEAFLETTEEIANEKNQETEKVPWWQPFFAFFSSPLQSGMAAASVLLLLGGAWLFFQNLQMRSELANLQNNRAEEIQEQEQIIAEKERRQKELENRLTDEKQRSELNEKQIQEIEEGRRKLEQEIADLRQRKIQTPQSSPASPNSIPKAPVSAPQRSLIALVLSPSSSVRSGGAGMSRVNLSPSVKNLRLSLLLETEEKYQSYRASLKTVNEGTEIWSASNLTARGKGKQQRILLNVPAKILQRADYELVINGINQNGEAEIDSYYFSVLK